MKLFIVSRKAWVAALSLCAAVAVTAATAGCLVAARNNRLLPIYSVEDSRKRVAITFDAAWTADEVDELIGVLDKYDAKVTVFAVGEWVEKYPDAVKKLADAGHELANHSDAHKHLDSMTNEEFCTDVKACNKRIEEITGMPVTLYRGPYGEYNDMAVAAIAEMGMYYLQWDCDSLDWKPNYTVDMVVQAALKNIRSGSVILMHIGAEPMIKALPVILERLNSEGYSFVTAGELIYKENYEIDHTGRQWKDK